MKTTMLWGLVFGLRNGETNACSCPVYMLMMIPSSETKGPHCLRTTSKSSLGMSPICQQSPAKVMTGKVRHSGRLMKGLVLVRGC